MKEMTYIVKEMHPLSKEQRKLKLSLKAIELIQKEEVMTYEKPSGSNISSAIR